MTTTLGGSEQTRAVGDHDIEAAESFTTAVGIFDEAKAGVVEAQARAPVRVCLYRQLDDLPPPRGEVRGIGILEFGCSDAANDVGADGGLPVPAGRRPGAVEGLTADLLVDFEQAAAGVARMELHDAEFPFIVL